MKVNYIIEIIIHGRGGQGVVTAAEVLAMAAAFEGKNSQAFPVFGSERRGAPVKSFCRINDGPIRGYQQIYNPDIVMVIDEKMSDNQELYSNIKPGGVVILNTSKKFQSDNIISVDASEVADIIGKPIYNIAMLGALIKATGVCSFSSLTEAVKNRFNDKIAEKNILAAEKCYNVVKC